MVTDISRFLSDSIFDDVCDDMNWSVHLTLNAEYFIPPEPDGCGLLCSWPPKNTFEGKIISNYYVWHTLTDRVNKISGRMKSIWRANDKLCQLNCQTKIKSCNFIRCACHTHTHTHSSNGRFSFGCHFTHKFPLTFKWIDSFKVANAISNHNHNESDGKRNISIQCLAFSFII